MNPDDRRMPEMSDVQTPSSKLRCTRDGRYPRYFISQCTTLMTRTWVHNMEEKFLEAGDYSSLSYEQPPLFNRFDMFDMDLVKQQLDRQVNGQMKSLELLKH